MGQTATRPVRGHHKNSLDHKASHLFTLDVVGVLDYTAAHGKVNARSGEEKLCLALLETAIGALGLRHKNGEYRLEHIEAIAWLRGETAPDALSFAFCCDHLGLDASFLLRGLRLDLCDQAHFQRIRTNLKGRSVFGPGGPVAKRRPFETRKN